MELVELQSRAGLEQEANMNATQDDLNEARKATGIKKKGTFICQLIKLLSIALIAPNHSCCNWIQDLHPALHPRSLNHRTRSPY